MEKETTDEVMTITLRFETYLTEAGKQRVLEHELARRHGDKAIVIRFTFGLNKASVVYKLKTPNQ